MLRTTDSESRSLPDTMASSGLVPGRQPMLLGGATVTKGGVEFRLVSRNATSVTLLLYDREFTEPNREIELDPRLHKLGDTWAIHVPDLGPGQLYAYRVDGPNEPEEGHRFDPSIPLLDPYAKALTTNEPDPSGQRSATRGDALHRPRCVVVDESFDWQGVGRPAIPLADTIVYEMHVRGLTAHHTSETEAPGTYQGIIEKIPYLKDLGITAIELLPVHEFDYQENIRRNPDTGKPLTNYWGYSTLGFFAPCGRYSSDTSRGGQVREFQTMVRELHRAGIEVLLDVVYNHTAEGNHLGPTINFKGIDNSLYYHLEHDRRYYKDYSGCGNSLTCNHPVVAQMIVDSLIYWVTRMGVDGFRFDLASVLCRDREGHLVSHAPLVERIAEEPLLRETKIIAEAWDAAGAYQVGWFPGGRWAEWNGRYRDDIRQFWRGDPGKTGALATRLTGSSDLYQTSGRRPFHSINFITSHDGFPMNDLVSYNHKHNRANGEDNRDGDNNNHSYNYGEEGPTTDDYIEEIRNQQIKNMLATLLLSQGVPMLLGGDEFRRTQHGNNNAYCQDNEISWFDWRRVRRNGEMLRFCRLLAKFRRAHPVLRRHDFFDGNRRPGRPIADVNWFDAFARPKVWEHDDHTLICLLDGHPAGARVSHDVDILMLFNASIVYRRFILPQVLKPAVAWRRLLDTGCEAPHDIEPEGEGPTLEPNSRYPLRARSMACFYRWRE